MNQGISESICGQVNLFEDNIKFEVFFPICKPGKICYQFFGNSESCLEGDHFEIELGGWTIIEHPIAPFSPNGYCTQWDTEYWVKNGGGFSLKEYNKSGISYPAPSNVDNNPDSIYTTSPSFTINNCGMTLSYLNQLKNAQLFSANEWGFAPSPPTNKFYPTKIKIYNANNNLVGMMQGDGMPTTRVMSGTSHYDFTKPDITTIYKRAFPGSRIAVENPTNTSVRAVEYFPILPFIPIGSPSISDLHEIIRLENPTSSTCTIPPMIKWSCLGACSDGEKCPDNTCTSYSNGDHICCIGEDGKILAIVSKDCQQADCNCED